MSVEKAKADLNVLEQKLAQLNEEIENISNQTLKLSNYIEVSETYSKSLSIPVDQNASQEIVKLPSLEENEGITIPRYKSPPQSVARNVREVINILKDEGHPVPTRTLVQKLNEKGIHIGGKIPITGLSSALSRQKTLLAVDRSQGWRLVEWDMADVTVKQDTSKK